METTINTTMRGRRTRLRLTGGAVATAALLVLAGCGQVQNAGVPAADPAATGATSSAQETEPISAEPTPEPTEVGDDSEGMDDDARYDPCPETAGWDTSEEATDEITLAGAITTISAGSTDCYDSINVIMEPSDVELSYIVRYVDEVPAQGTGDPVEVRGGAAMEVLIGSPLGDPDDGSFDALTQAIDQLVDISSFFAIEDVAFGGSFEGMTTLAIGVSSQLPFIVETDVTGDGAPYLTISVATAPSGGFGPEDEADNADEYAGGWICDEIDGWDTSREASDLSMGESITGLSAGGMGCFDEFTVYLTPSPTVAGYAVEYVDVVTQDGSGFPVPVAGNAALQVVVGAAAYDPMTMEPTLDTSDPDNLLGVAGEFEAIQQIAFAGSFEGMTTFAIGVAEELPFTVEMEPNDGAEHYLTIRIAHP